MAGASSKSPDKAPTTSPQRAQPMESFYLDAALGADGGGEESAAMGGGGAAGGSVQFGNPVRLSAPVTFQLRFSRPQGEKARRELQMYMADPDYAVCWNGVALEDDSDLPGGNFMGGRWETISSDASRSMRVWLDIHLKLLYDRKLEKRTITETIDGVEREVERKFVKDTFRKVDDDCKKFKVVVGARPSETKDQWIAKKAADAGGGTPLSTSPLVRWRLLADNKDDGSQELEAEVHYSILVGGVYDGKIVNNVLGAIQIVNFNGLESYVPEDSGTGSASASQSASQSESAGMSESMSAGVSGSGGGPGGASGSGGGPGGSGSSTPPPPQTGTTGRKKRKYVGEIRYVCPNFQQRIDTYDPETDTVTEGEWTNVTTAVPHSGEHA